jgi:hypothetical protein
MNHKHSSWGFHPFVCASVDLYDFSVEKNDVDVKEMKVLEVWCVAGGCLVWN